MRIRQCMSIYESNWECWWEREKPLCRERVSAFRAWNTERLWHKQMGIAKQNMAKRSNQRVMFHRGRKQERLPAVLTKGVTQPTTVQESYRTPIAHMKGRARNQWQKRLTHPCIKQPQSVSIKQVPTPLLHLMGERSARNTRRCDLVCGEPSGC